MKKNLLKIAFIALFGIGIGYSTYTSNQKSTLSDLSINNVEALAWDEGGAGFNCRWSDPGAYRFCNPWGYGLGCPCYM